MLPPCRPLTAHADNFRCIRTALPPCCPNASFMISLCSSHADFYCCVLTALPHCCPIAAPTCGDTVGQCSGNMRDVMEHFKERISAFLMTLSSRTWTAFLLQSPRDLLVSFLEVSCFAYVRMMRRKLIPFVGAKEASHTVIKSCTEMIYEKTMTNIRYKILYISFAYNIQLPARYINV